MIGKTVEGDFLYNYYLAVSILFLSVIWYLRSRKDDSNSIPGPKQLPLIGNAHQLDTKPYLTFMKWAKQYGPIMYLKLATEKMVVLSDPAIIKELFNDPLTAGRQSSNHPVIYELTEGPYGIINAEGEVWEAQRKFTIKTLREFGFGKSSMENIIMTEVNAMTDWFRKTQGALITGNHIFEGAMVNILWTMVAGKRCDWTNEESRAVRTAGELIGAMQQVTDSGLYFAPFLRFILPERMGWTRFRKAVADFKQLFEETVQDHKETLDKSNLRDFIDYYLKEIEETEDERSSFYQDIGHKGLVAVLSDLFLAGSVTTAGTLSWFLLYISHHSEVQRKAQKQIDEVIGSSRSPTLLDRKNLPYIEAVVLESLRLASVAPLGGPHRALADINYKGFVIKKDITIIGNLYGVHHDQAIWGGDADNFKPERFLNEDGSEIIRQIYEAVIPFEEGKRKCLGEKLARDELFLFVAGMLQNFNILPESGKKPNFESLNGLFVHAPHDFKVMVNPRNEE